MERKGPIMALRSYMRKEELSALIVPSNDPHFGEYIPDHYKCREWLSNFTGSAGTLVVTLDKAALWTDSRYFVQAENELSGSGIELMKMKVEGTPSISQWILSNLEEDGIVAIDENLFTYQEYCSWVDELSPLNVTMIEDPFDEIWNERPVLEFHPIEPLDVSISGESTSSKHKRLVEQIALPYPFVYIISALDEIAWLCNIRGRDVEYNPLVISYAVVTPERVELFVNPEAVTPQAEQHLFAQGVVIRDYNSFSNYLSQIDKSVIKIFSSNRVTAKHYLSVENILPDLTTGGTLNLMKSQKNEIELAGFRKACEEDSLAWKKLLEYIRANILDKSEEEYSASPVTEYQLAMKLIEFRKESPDYRGESFEPIVAYGANAALPHYSATEDNSAVIMKKGLLLIDTGAHYAYGTTDTTRTIPMGPLTQEEREDYTAVLKGMVRLSMAKFPKGTRGAQLDILARGCVFERGKIYLHGTGHGIGHYLCVHEGPQSIRMEENPVALLPGMVLSNEPAIYQEGSHGIRIENTIVVSVNEMGYQEFDTITKVPINEEPIIESALSDVEKQWLYHHDFISQLS